MKYNHPQKSIVFTCLAAQHIMKKIATGKKETISFRVASHGGWREMPSNLSLWLAS